MKCLAIERVHTDDTEKHQERESFWIRKMRTLFPQGLICSSGQNKLFLPFEQPLLPPTPPFFFGLWGWSYLLEVSWDTAFIHHQANIFVVFIEQLWWQTNLCRFATIARILSPFYTLLLSWTNHMIINKTLWVALVFQPIIFISSSSLSPPTPSLSPSVPRRLKMMCFFQRWCVWQNYVSVSPPHPRGRLQGRKFGHSWKTACLIFFIFCCFIYIIYIYIYIYIYLSIYIYICIYISICIYLSIYIFIYIYR